jgi:hypothetical protein
MASKGVRSSQAISMMRSISCSERSFKSIRYKQHSILFVFLVWKEWKNSIYPKKPAWLVSNPSPGAKSGRKIGMKSSIAQTAVGLSATNKKVHLTLANGLGK